MKLSPKIGIVIFLSLGGGILSNEKDNPNEKRSMNVMEVFANEGRNFDHAMISGYVQDLGDDGIFLFSSKEHGDLKLRDYGIIIRAAEDIEPDSKLLATKKWLVVSGKLNWIRDVDFEGYVDYRPLFEMTDSSFLIDK